MGMDPLGGGVKGMVKQIIEAERTPVRQLEARKESENKRIKLFGEFKTAVGNLDKVLTEMTDFRKFRELKADLGNGKDLLDVTLDKNIAEPGNYEMRINEMAKRTSVISNGFENPEEPFSGTGFIVMEGANGEDAEVYVSEAQGSLKGIANLINSQPDSKVTASIIRDETKLERPYKLIMTAKNEGEAEDIEFPQFYFVDPKRDFYLDDERSAQNGNIEIDGFAIETRANEVPDFLTGIGISVKDANPDKLFTMKITEDWDKIVGKIKALVENVNKVLKFINEQNTIDEKSDTRTTFAGDTSLQGIEYKVRNLIHGNYVVGDEEQENLRVVRISDYGIRFQRDGQLQFDEGKFKTFMQKDFKTLSQALVGPEGFVPMLSRFVKTYNSPIDGLIKLREKSLQARVKTLDDSIEQKEKFLKRREESLISQFSKMQANLSTLQNQQAYLSSMMGGGGGGSVVDQLMGGK